MKIILSVLIFILVSLSFSCFLGYIDEGNSANYSTFWTYLATDAFKDNFVTDTGRHVGTSLFFVSMIITFTLLNRFQYFKTNYLKGAFVSSIAFPITAAGLLLFLYVSILAVLKIRNLIF